MFRIELNWISNMGYKKELSQRAEILWGFMKLEKNKMLKISAFYGDKQKVFFNKKNMRHVKVWILEKVTSERCNSDQLNIFFITG